MRYFLLLTASFFVAACPRDLPVEKPLLPPLMVWAWERPEDLRFLDPKTTGIAFLTQTLTMTESGIEQHPRQQPLQSPEGIRRLAVTRIEKTAPGIPLEGAVDELVKLILSKSLAVSTIVGVQIDFDATVSERAAYVELLKKLRAALPSRLLLSATGLASWCVSDTWLTQAPVDLWVPQFFRMGNDSKEFRSRLQERERLPAVCQKAWGMALDETFTQRPRQTLFLFKPAISWTREDFLNITAAFAP